jgi:hypothetical protein
MRIKLYIAGTLYSSPCATGEIYLRYSYNDTPSLIDIVIVVLVRVAPEQKIIRRDIQLNYYALYSQRILARKRQSIQTRISI